MWWVFSIGLGADLLPELINRRCWCCVVHSVSSKREIALRHTSLQNWHRSRVGVCSGTRTTGRLELMAVLPSFRFQRPIYATLSATVVHWHGGNLHANKSAFKSHLAHCCTSMGRERASPFGPRCASVQIPDEATLAHLYLWYAARSSSVRDLRVCTCTLFFRMDWKHPLLHSIFNIAPSGIRDSM